MRTNIRQGIIPLNIYLLYIVSKHDIYALIVKVNFIVKPILLPVSIPFILIPLFISTIMVSKLFDDIESSLYYESEYKIFVPISRFTEVTGWLVLCKIIDSRFIISPTVISWNKWTNLIVENMKKLKLTIDKTTIIIALICVFMTFLPAIKILSERIQTSINNEYSRKVAFEAFFHRFYIIRLIYLFIVIEIIANWSEIIFVFMVCVILLIYIPESRNYHVLKDELKLFCWKVSLNWEKRKEWIEELLLEKSNSKKQKKELQICIKKHKEKYEEIKKIYDHALLLIYCVSKDERLLNGIKALSFEDERSIGISNLLINCLQEHETEWKGSFINDSDVLCNESVMKGLLHEMITIAEQIKAESTNLFIKVSVNEEERKVSVEIISAIKHEFVGIVQDIVTVFEEKSLAQNIENKNISNYIDVIKAKLYMDLLKLKVKLNINCDDCQTLKLTLKIEEKKSEEIV